VNDTVRMPFQREGNQPVSVVVWENITRDFHVKVEKTPTLNFKAVGLIFTDLRGIGSDLNNWAKLDPVSKFFGSEYSNGRLDAARHAYISFIAALLHGEADAERAGIANEFYSPNKSNEHVMDLWNNRIGRSLVLRYKNQTPLEQQDKDIKMLQERNFNIFHVWDIIKDSLDDGSMLILDNVKNPEGSALLKPSNR